MGEEDKGQTFLITILPIRGHTQKPLTTILVLQFKQKMDFLRLCKALVGYLDGINLQVANHQTKGQGAI